MAVIFDIDRAIASSQFNVLGLSIPMLLQSEVEAFEKGSKLGKIFTFQKLNSYSESFHTTVSHGGFRPSEDMEIAKLHDWEDSYGKTFTAQTWKDSFAISQEALEDNKDLDINRKVKEFSTNYGRTREEYGAAVVAGSLADSFTYGGKKFSAKSIDTIDGTVDGIKQKYFDRYHLTSVAVANEQDFVEMNGREPWSNAGSADTTYPGNQAAAGVYATAPQSNKYLVYGGSSTDETKGINVFKVNPEQGDTMENVAVYDQIRFLFDKIREIGATHKDYDGRIVPLDYSRIIMPVNSLLSKTIKAALGGRITEGPFEGPLSGDQFELVEWAYLNGKPGFTSKEMGLIILDPTRNARELGFSFWDRIPLTVKSYLQDGNDTMVWYGRARFKADTCDPYSAVYIALGDLGNLSAQAFSGGTTAAGKFNGGTTPTTATVAITNSNATFIDLRTFEVKHNPTVKTGKSSS